MRLIMDTVTAWIHTRVPHDLMVDQLNQRIDHEVGHVLSSLGEWVNRTFLNLVVRLTCNILRLANEFMMRDVPLYTSLGTSSGRGQLLKERIDP